MYRVNHRAPLKTNKQTNKKKQKTKTRKKTPQRHLKTSPKKI